MLTYTIIFTLSYYGLYTNLPLLEDIECQQTYLLQIIRQSILLYACYRLSNLIWRQKFVPKLRIKPANHAVLITGCDTGFGNLLARKLDASGFKVFAGCLFPEKEDAKKLEAECSSRLRILKIDVTSDDDVEVAYDVVAKELDKGKQELLAVVNNAGIFFAGEVDFGKTIEPFERHLQVNCLGAIRVTKVFNSLLRRCKSSPRLINVSSLASRVSTPGMVAYSVSKSAILSFSDGIRAEIKKWKVQVICVEPAMSRTSLLSLDTHHEGLLKLWKTSRPIDRQDYGETYFENTKKLMTNRVDNLAALTISRVVDGLYDSVTIKHPEIHMKIYSSELERLKAWIFIDIIPHSWLSYLLHHDHTAITGYPQMLAAH